MNLFEQARSVNVATSHLTTLLIQIDALIDADMQVEDATIALFHEQIFECISLLLRAQQDVTSLSLSRKQTTISHCVTIALRHTVKYIYRSIGEEYA